MSLIRDEYQGPYCGKINNMSSQPPSNDIFLVNPYQSHPSLTPLEADVLWEYAKLAQNLQMVCLI